MKFQKKAEEELTDYFSTLCDDCLMLAVREYISRATHRQLREIDIKIQLILESPCKTPECQEECNEDCS